MRKSYKDAQRCFEYLLKVTGNRKARSYNDVGGWRLDCAPEMGGCVIDEISNRGGGVSNPIELVRLRPTEFCKRVHFATRTIATLTGKAPVARHICKR